MSAIAAFGLDWVWPPDWVAFSFFKYYQFLRVILQPRRRFSRLQTRYARHPGHTSPGYQLLHFPDHKLFVGCQTEQDRTRYRLAGLFLLRGFFPCLTAGPIDRAGTLIPQLKTLKTFDYDQAVDGMRQILWGLFKKLVIADNCALFTNGIFDQYKTLPGSTLLFGAILFPIQLYADFSGYSDIAIGIASLLGFNVTRNFAYPFFAQNIVQYWRRWHMSLTSWLTDYVFTPLSIQLRDWGKSGTIIAVIITFTAIGIWHGANWSYVLYGFLNGCFFIPAILSGTMNKREKPAEGGSSWSVRAFLNRIATFTLVSFSLIIFRANDLSQAFGYYRRMFSRTLVTRPVLTERPYAVGAPDLYWH